MSDPKRVEQFPTAYIDLVTAVAEGQRTVTVQLESPQAAMAMRRRFYSFRRALAARDDLAFLRTMADSIIVRRIGSALQFSPLDADPESIAIKEALCQKESE
jgi:hypothetical protein